MRTLRSTSLGNLTRHHIANLRINDGKRRTLDQYLTFGRGPGSALGCDLVDADVVIIGDDKDRDIFPLA